MGTLYLGKCGTIFPVLRCKVFIHVPLKLVSYFFILQIYAIVLYRGGM
jgi:hypothetical protein